MDRSQVCEILGKAKENRMDNPKAENKNESITIYCACGDAMKPMEYDPDVPGLEFHCIVCCESVWVDGYRPSQQSLVKMNEELVEAVKNLLYWHKKSHETPEMLLSSRHSKSDECAEIMKKYGECFINLEKVLSTHRSN